MFCGIPSLFIDLLETMLVSITAVEFYLHVICKHIHVQRNLSSGVNQIVECYLLL